MKPILKRSGLLLMCAALLAGCSTSTTTTSSSTSSKESSVTSKDSSTSQASSQVLSTSEKTSTSSKASSQESSKASSTSNATNQAQTDNALLNALLANIEDDEKAEEAWMNIFQNTVEAHNGVLESEGDGEIYEYQTASESSFVTANLLYQTARLDGMSTNDDNVLIADFSDLANSIDEFISGTGVLISMGNSEADNKGLVVSTTDTQEQFKGSVTQVFTPSYNKETLGATNLRDSVINCGLARTVDPIHNSSLYTYSVKKKRKGYRLSLEVKDLATYKAAAAGLVPLVDNLDGKVVLGLDDIEGETFYFDFDQNGVLTEVGNNIFHAVYTTDQKVYVNVRNVTEVEGLDTDEAEDFVASVGGLLKEDLSDGADFSIKTWQ